MRATLKARYKPSTVNRMLSAYRGVLKQTWRLGLIDAETYQRTIDVENLKAGTLLRGRALDGEELTALFRACAEDPTPAGRRDAAMLAVFYGAGLRRAELAGLDVDDFETEACSVTVRNGKRRKERTVYLTRPGCRLVNAWIQTRGTEVGPLFCPIGQTGEVRISRMRGESIASILTEVNLSGADLDAADLTCICLDAADALRLADIPNVQWIRVYIGDSGAFDASHEPEDEQYWLIRQGEETLRSAVGRRIASEAGNSVTVAFSRDVHRELYLI